MNYLVYCENYVNSFVSDLRFFDELDKALELFYNLSSGFFASGVTVGLYLFEVGDDFSKCIMFLDICPSFSDYKED